MPTPARQHSLDNLLGDRLGKQRLAVKPLEQRRLGVVLAHEHGAHLGRVVVRDQLGGQALVERDGRGLGRRVVDQRGRGYVARQRSDRHDHPVVGGDHGGQELLREEEVGERVYLEGQVNVLLGGGENGFAARDACVVDQDGWVAERGADGGGGFGDGRGRREVAFEEADRGRCWACQHRSSVREEREEVTLVCELLDVQHGDLDALLSKQLHDDLANAVGAARHDDDFLAPHVRVAGPVVGDAVAEPGADSVVQAEHEQRLQVLERGRVARSKAAAIERVFGCQEQRQRDQRVQRRELEEPRDGVAGDACIIRQLSRARRGRIAYLRAPGSIRCGWAWWRFVARSSVLLAMAWKE